MIFPFRRPKPTSELLWDSYMDALELAHKSCKAIDWVAAGDAWTAWRDQYASDYRQGLVSTASSHSANVIDLTKILRQS